MRWRAPSIMRTRPASTSSATTAPSAPTCSAIAVALPPGAAATSATRSPGSGASTLTTAWLPWSCGVARPSRTAASRPGSPTPRTIERVGDQATGLDLGARRPRARRRARSTVIWRGSGRSVTAAGSFIATSASRPRSRPSSWVRRSTNQSGYESATASSAGSGNGFGRRVSPRRLAFTNPRARGDARTDRVDGRRDRGVRRRVVQELVRAEAQRGAHRRVEAVERTLHHVPEQVVEPALRAHGAVDEVGGEGAVAVGEVGLRQHRGQHDVRVRAVLDPDERVEGDDARE